MDVIELEVLNWAKYNPRVDRKKSSWFRIENTIATEPKFDDLSASNRFVAVCVFAEASKSGGGVTKIYVKWLAKNLNVKPKEIIETIQHLEKHGVVVVSLGSQVVSPGSPTNERTNDTNERTDDIEIQVGEINALVELWNTGCGSLPKVEKLTDSRKRSARSQLAKYRDIEHWRLALTKLTSSDFVLAKWRPNFDDYLDESKRTKAIEGRYDNVTSITGSSKSFEETMKQAEAIYAAKR